MATRSSPSGGPLPRSFLCRLCRQEKASSAYSKRQIQKWYNEKRNDRCNAVTPQNVGLTCQDHGATQREIKCSYCSRLKVVDRFSKRQRNDLNPRCIECTEFILHDNNDEQSTYGYYGTEDNEKLLADEDEDDEDSEDEIGSRYSGPTPITALIDRLEGYSFPTTGQDTTTEAVSTTNSVAISRWDGNTKGAGSSDNPGGSVRTMVGIPPQTVQSYRDPVGISGSPYSSRDVSSLRGYTPVANNNTGLIGVAPHPNQLFPKPNMNHETHNTEAGQSFDAGNGIQKFPGQFAASQPRCKPMNEEETKERALALANMPAKQTRPTGQKPRVENQRNKWYKGDNRKVFYANRKYAPDTVGDRTEAAYDSDSSDDM
ncbi:hypothetical protein SAMD00023353_0502460 [Rosellinia necatrix]|uniref:Stc1 domain-containing protein n=1 Tax=Rosellinia necatrix TaxID=77044 RepID=A0A1S7UKP6_ROSNE|nr:hypothetical protein SAMD00023353_0502460 [Rosellinia necatrix]